MIPPGLTLSADSGRFVCVSLGTQPVPVDVVESVACGAPADAWSSMFSCLPPLTNILLSPFPPSCVAPAALDNARLASAVCVWWPPNVRRRRATVGFRFDVCLRPGLALTSLRGI